MPWRSSPWIVLLSFFLGACGRPAPQPKTIDGPVSQAQIDSIVSAYTFNYDSPILPDSGSHAILPMSIGNDRRDKVVSSSGSYGYGSEWSPRLWNVLFVDLKTHRTHLLTERRLYIEGLFHYKAEQGPVLAKHLLYTIIDTDNDRNGKLDLHDPTRLCISDLAGHGLTTLSPAEEDLQSWDVLEGRDLLTLRTRSDDDGDRQFEPHEATHLYLYDLATRQLHPLMTDELQQQVNKLFFEQWLEKK